MLVYNIFVTFVHYFVLNLLTMGGGSFVLRVDIGTHEAIVS